MNSFISSNLEILQKGMLVSPFLLVGAFLLRKKFKVASRIILVIGIVLLALGSYVSVEFAIGQKEMAKKKHMERLKEQKSSFD